LEMSIDGAQSILLNVTGGPDVSLYEINEAAEKVAEAVDPEANIIFGSVIDPDMEDSIRITVVATGFGKEPSSIPSFGQGTGGTTKSGDKKDSAGGVEIPAWMR
ncbi:MAG: cell division protein FtsZ, partial [Megasphaera sp.]|nr:cell division protein FtsZ [Megasphaera sp.]